MHSNILVFVDAKNQLALISMDKNNFPKIVVLMMTIYDYHKLLTIRSTSFVLISPTKMECR
jgi:hypothetical protein